MRAYAASHFLLPTRLRLPSQKEVTAKWETIAHVDCDRAKRRRALAPEAACAVRRNKATIPWSRRQ